MKKVFLTGLIALAFLIPAHAQTTPPDSPNRFELGWSPISYLRQEGKDLWGGSLALAMRRSERLSYVFDLSIHQTRGLNPFTTSAYRFGLRYYAPARGKFTPFGEVLAGGASLSAIRTTVGNTTVQTEPGHNGFSIATGGGVDYGVRRWFSWRVLQADYSLIRAGGTSNGVRVHTGGVFHF